MDSSGYDQLRAHTDALQVQVDSMLESYEHQLRDIAEVRDDLAVRTAEGWSADNLIHVTSTSAGVPVQVWVDPAAFKRSTPEKLAASFAEAAQVAARMAQSQVSEAMAPILAAGQQFDIRSPFGDDLDLRRIGDSILPPPPPEPVHEPESAPSCAPRHLVEDEEDNGPHWKGW